MKRETVSVIILTYNESLHIARAIESVRAFSDEVLVVDSFSSDDTARSPGATAPWWCSTRSSTRPSSSSGRWIIADHR